MCGYPEEKVIGDGELPVQLSADVVDFFLQHSCVVEHSIDVRLLLANVSDDFENTRCVVVSAHSKAIKKLCHFLYIQNFYSISIKVV